MISDDQAYPWKDLIVMTSSGGIDLPASKLALKGLSRDPKMEPRFEVLLDWRDIQCTMSIADIFELAAYMADPCTRIPTRQKIAILVSSGLHFEHAQFLEVCATNRGVHLRAFQDYEKANEWLKAAYPRIPRNWILQLNSVWLEGVDHASDTGHAKAANKRTGRGSELSVRSCGRPLTMGLSYAKQNHLLASLPDLDYMRLLPALEPVSMPLGWALYEAGGKQTHVYFPITSIVSLLYVTQTGVSAEMAMTGNDGLVGIATFMGGETTHSRAMVNSAGHGYRLKANVLKAEFDRGGRLQQFFLRFTQALITQMSQTAACNRHHSVSQQLCRRLLLTLDRLPDNRLVTTQKLIANMLGVRREAVTEAAGKLQTDGGIRYSRGRIEVLDRAKLEDRACECYAVVKEECDRLLQATTVSFRASDKSAVCAN